jgi:hypothetical protein
MGSYNVPTYYANVTLRIGFGVPTNQRVVEHTIFAGFTQGMDQQGVGLLGQSGFFDHFKVAFDRTASLFHVELPDTP